MATEEKIQNRVYTVGSAQTSTYSTSEMETITSEKKDQEIQTDAQSASVSGQVDEEKLAAWLKRIYPQVKKELEDVAHSKAFKGYKLSTDNSDAKCKLVQTVDVTSHVKEATIGSYVSALSWNCSNKILAVSCTHKHNSWCYHEGAVLFFTLDRDDNLPESPTLKLTSESCVVVLGFHSILPSVIAGGLFSGSINVWNVENKEEQTVLRVEGHKDGVTQLSWIIDINSVKNVLLASSSLDGYLFLWEYNNIEGSLTIKERHQTQSSLFPKNSVDKTLNKVVRGITCFDFSKHIPEMFIVGAEGGLVIEASLLGTTKLAGGGDAPILSSAVKYYEPHKGEINSLCFSPNRKDMFMSSGSDLEVRIYMIGQEEPAKVIFLKQALSCISWVPYEEGIVCGCGKGGVIEIFQLPKGKIIEDTVQDKVKIQNLTQIQINKSRINIVAVGTENGCIQMWRVPWGLFGKSSV